MPIHFGVTVLKGKRGLELIRDQYALINKRNSLKKFDSMLSAYEDELGHFYTDEWCEMHKKNCLKNFDLHMELFANLDESKFNKEIEGFLEKFNFFEEIRDLKELEEESGYYVMILDKYKQVYVGTSYSIMKRIRQHWSTTKSFDRLLFPIGAVDRSIMSIDSFRALDTTRILAYKTKKTYIDEDSFISFFSSEFVSNRLSGGKIEFGLMQAITMMKSRNLENVE